MNPSSRPSSPEKAISDPVLASSMATGGDGSRVKTAPPPAPNCSIPPAMLSSRCAVRISFRLSPVSDKPLSICDRRYTEWHAGMHHELPHHGSVYPLEELELDTKTGLNSAGQYFYVHRLIRSSSEGKLVEISAHCPHGENPRGCNCITNPSFLNVLYGSQNEVFDNDTKERKKKLADRRIALAKQQALVEINPKLDLQIENVRKAIVEMANEVAEMREMVARANSGQDPIF